MARKLQNSLLPKDPVDERLKFSYIYRPSESLGGDFLDIFHIDDRHIGIYIADVSGHGVPSSLLTVFLKSSINKKLTSPAQALKELYAAFNSSRFDPEMYITIFYSVLDLEENRITYSNAGHNAAPVIFGNHRFEVLRMPGTPISSWLASPSYVDRASQLNPDDRIFFYTDGIMELKNKSRQQFGEKRLLEQLRKHNFASDSLLDGILERAFEFSGLTDADTVNDDITMALVEIKASKGSLASGDGS